MVIDSACRGPTTFSIALGERGKRYSLLLARYMSSSLIKHTDFLVEDLLSADCRWRDRGLSASYRMSAVVPGTGADGTTIWGSRAEDVPPLHPLP